MSEERPDIQAVFALLDARYERLHAILAKCKTDEQRRQWDDRINEVVRLRREVGKL